MNTRDRSKGISLGIFAGNLGDLQSDAARATSWGCDLIHFDVMDGIFVPQMVGGPGFVKSLSGEALMDVHLMVQRPADHVESYIKAGADIITIHAESEGCAHAITQARKAADEAGSDALIGLAIMPGTALEDLAPLLALKPDILLVLALDPRDGKPANIPAACLRVTKLRALAPNAIIAFDGGVTLGTIDEISTAAPDIVVSGSAVMRADDPQTAFNTMHQALSDTRVTEPA